MRVPLQGISPQILNLTSLLNGAVTVNIWKHAFHRTVYHNNRSGLLQLFANKSHCSAACYYSTRSVTFENQPPSWLFVSNAVAGAYGAQVNLELDLDERLSGISLEKLRSNLSLRGLQFDVDDLVQKFQELRVCEKRRNNLEDEKLRILAEMKLLKAENPSDDVKLSQKNLYEKFLQIKKSISDSQQIWDLETEVVLTALKLPNDLHESTPVKEDMIIREVTGKIDPPSTLSHIEIAKKFDLIKFSNVGPKAYYLKGDLVFAEMALINTACSYMESKNYRHMAGPEFFKTPIMEGCGLNIHNPDEVLTMLNISKDLVEPMNHLAGVSLPTFAAYVAKTSIGDNIIPLKMFACGRCYQNGHLPGLFGALQSTQAKFLCVNKENSDSQFQESLDLIWNFLEPLGFPLRQLQICARGLRREERRRFEIQMFAPSRQEFIPVAHVADLSDFVSRRLMVLHNQNHSDIRSASHVHMISGTLLNITSLLAIWMEYSNTDQKKFLLCTLQSVQTRGCSGQGYSITMPAPSERYHDPGTKVKNTCLLPVDSFTYLSSTLSRSVNIDCEESKAIVDKCLELGINFFDTAEGYKGSETVLGKALLGRRQDTVIATKFGGRDGPSTPQYSAQDIEAAVTNSLKNLQTSYVDIVQIHFPSFVKDTKETVQELERLKALGKIRYYGLSNYGPKNIENFMDAGGKPVVNQMCYNLLWRSPEHAVIPACIKHGINVLAYSPLQQGLLTGKFQNLSDVPEGRRRGKLFSKDSTPLARHGQEGAEEEVDEALKGISQICKEAGVEMSRAALSWILQQDGLEVVISGASSPAQVVENSKIIKLHSDVVQKLTEVTDPLKKKIGLNLDQWSGVDRCE